MICAWTIRRRGTPRTWRHGCNRWRPAGAIWVGEATYRLAREAFDWQALGPQAVKGKADAVPVYALHGPRLGRSRFEVVAQRGLTRFVGRDPELQQLLAAWEQTEQGAGRVVSVVGEAGIGKSRLLYEFKQWLAQADASACRRLVFCLRRQHLLPALSGDRAGLLRPGRAGSRGRRQTPDRPASHDAATGPEDGDALSAQSVGLPGRRRPLCPPHPGAHPAAHRGGAHHPRARRRPPAALGGDPGRRALDRQSLRRSPHGGRRGHGHRPCAAGPGVSPRIFARLGRPNLPCPDCPDAAARGQQCRHGTGHPHQALRRAGAAGAPDPGTEPGDGAGSVGHQRRSRPSSSGSLSPRRMGIRCLSKS